MHTYSHIDEQYTWVNCIVEINYDELVYTIDGMVIVVGALSNIVL